MRYRMKHRMDGQLDRIDPGDGDDHRGEDREQVAGGEQRRVLGVVVLAPVPAVELADCAGRLLLVENGILAPAAARIVWTASLLHTVRLQISGHKGSHRVEHLLRGA